MKDFDSSDHRPDPVIGRLLREHLVPDDKDAFVVRMQAAARQGGLGRGAPPRRRGFFALELPEAWFRPGIAAAAALLVGVLVGAQVADGGSGSVWLAEALRPAGAPADLFAVDARPDPQLFLAPLLEAQ
jgi:hypothetical protein